MFRLFERFYQFFGTQIWYVPLKSPLSPAGISKMTDYIKVCPFSFTLLPSPLLNLSYTYTLHTRLVPMTPQSSPKSSLPSIPQSQPGSKPPLGPNISQNLTLLTLLQGPLLLNVSISVRPPLLQFLKLFGPLNLL